MAEVKYLYGAAVQGIQGFIFQTNKLRDIVGASELVEEICTTKFASLVKKEVLDYKKAKEELKNDESAILFAAGNVKYIFDSKEVCERVVREFPKIVSEFAPGITVSQAVVKMEDDNFEGAVNDLEKRLRTQRNKPMRSLTTGLMGILRSRQTGLPVVSLPNEKGEEDLIDGATWAKLYEYDKKSKEVRKKTTLKLCQKAFVRYGESDLIKADQVAFNIEEITKNNDWIAVIHADGNGLGQIVQKIGKERDVFREFSQKLDEATTLAAVRAYEAVKNQFNNSDNKKDFIPIRPIVLGGDDLTIICRADLALKYTETFIAEFEKLTAEYLGDYIIKGEVFKGEVKDKLSACAGITYVKSSYPFYYAYELAETLCSIAKKDAKEGLDGELPKSCVMFHKVQDSFTEDWSAIVKRELTPQEGVSFEFGPYYIEKAKDNRWTLKELMEKAKALEGKEGNAVKSHLRNWMSLLHYNPGMAEQKLKRLISMTSDKDLLSLINEVTKKNEREYKKDGETKKKIVYPVYDILAVHTINTQKTK